MLLVGGLRMREGESREIIRQLNTSLTVQVVDTLTLHFEDICTHPEHCSGDVRHITSELSPDVDVEARARTKFRTVEQNEITLAVVIEVVPAPGLEMRIALPPAESSWCGT
jgi:hypothetical protein